MYRTSDHELPGRHTAPQTAQQFTLSQDDARVATGRRERGPLMGEPHHDPQSISDQPPSTGHDSLWTTSELAAYLGVPVATIYKWRQTNYGPPGYRIGKYVRFDQNDVTAWLATRREDD